MSQLSHCKLPRVWKTVEETVRRDDMTTICRSDDLTVPPLVGCCLWNHVSGKSCTSRLLNITQHIEDGYQESITGTAFVDLSLHMTQWPIDSESRKSTTQHKTAHYVELSRTCCQDRRFYVEQNNERNRWRLQKNDLPQGSVHSPTLFNIYTNNQPVHDGTRSFIYTDNICIIVQYANFSQVESTI